jgi:hypothetical protein
MTCDFIDALEVMRVTRVDACGKPIAGPNAFVTNCLSSINMTNVTQDQDDKVYTAANGQTCAIRRGCRTLLGYDLEINSMPISPELMEILTGNAGYLDANGDLVGVDSCADIPCKAGFALEFWASIIGSDTCDAQGTQRYLYVLLPWITNGLMADIEFGTDAVIPQFTGSTRAGGQWGTGPFNVVQNATNVPDKMTTALAATCHRRILITTTPPPAASCDFVTVPAIP